jgi:hypothetical protein
VKQTMQIINRTRGTLLGTKVRLADNWLSRLRGFLLRPEPRKGEGILLTPCNGIHTWGMRFPLDVVFLDGGGTVLEVIEDIPPRKTPKRVPRGRYVLEVPAGTIGATGTTVGDTCTWTRAPAPSLRLQEM